MATIRLKHSSYETIGSATISGMYAIAVHDRGEDPSWLVIEIEQTDMHFRRNNKGPEVIMMAEFAPLCLMEDILKLSEQGIKLELKVVEVSEPS